MTTLRPQATDRGYGEVAAPDPDERAIDRLEGAGFAAIPASNPCRNRDERRFEDPDGYRVVLQRSD